MNPAHTFQTYVFKTHFNIILPSIPRSSKWSPSFRFIHQSPHPFLPPWFNHQITSGVEWQ